MLEYCTGNRNQPGRQDSSFVFETKPTAAVPAMTTETKPTAVVVETKLAVATATAKTINANAIPDSMLAYLYEFLGWTTSVLLFLVFR